MFVACMLRVFGVSLACDKCFVCLSSAVSCLWPVFGVSVSIRRVACMLLQQHATAAHCNTPPRIMSLRPLIWVAVFMHFFGDLFRVLNLSRRYLTDLCNDFRLMWEQGAIHSIWFDRTEYDGGVQIIGCANSYHTPPPAWVICGVCRPVFIVSTPSRPDMAQHPKQPRHTCDPSVPHPRPT